MSKKVRNIIIGSVIAIILIILVVLVVKAVNAINNSKNDVERNSVFKYLTETYVDEVIPSHSPLYGIMNYSFTKLEDNINMEFLHNSHLVSYSELNSVGVDNIYKNKFGLTKEQYINQPNYISSPTSNCYYNQDVLKKENYNCDTVCAGDSASIITEITKKLAWVNIGEEEIKTYCMKNAIYPIDSDKKVFIDTIKMQQIFKEITGNDLTFGGVITESEYAQYGAYLIDKRNGLEENITGIKSVDVKSFKDNKVKAKYVATTDNGRDIDGTITLLKLDEDKYIVLENSNDLGNQI